MVYIIPSTIYLQLCFLSCRVVGANLRILARPSTVRPTSQSRSTHAMLRADGTNRDLYISQMQGSASQLRLPARICNNP
jgi:hypothetical protein